MKKNLIKESVDKKAFTLIEMLIVVLIIGIVAAIALPQYRKSVEKTVIAEAVENLRSIAQANQRYYMAVGAYAGANDIDSLDITIPGDIYSSGGYNRKETKYFIYAPNGTTTLTWLSVAQRKPYGQRYYLAIRAADPTKVVCNAYGDITAVQQKLCDEINAKGSL